MAHSNQFKFRGQFELCFGTAFFFVGFTRVFCLDKTLRLFISCYVLEVFLECVFGVVVLHAWWLVNGSSDKKGCQFAAILHSSNHQLVYGHIYITTRYYRVMV